MGMPTHYPPEMAIYSCFLFACRSMRSPEDDFARILEAKIVKLLSEHYTSDDSASATVDQVYSFFLSTSHDSKAPKAPGTNGHTSEKPKPKRDKAQAAERHLLKGLKALASHVASFFRDRAVTSLLFKASTEVLKESFMKTFLLPERERLVPKVDVFGLSLVLLKLLNSLLPPEDRDSLSASAPHPLKNPNPIPDHTNTGHASPAATQLLSPLAAQSHNDLPATADTSSELAQHPPAVDPTPQPLSLGASHPHESWSEFFLSMADMDYRTRAGFSDLCRVIEELRKL